MTDPLATAKTVSSWLRQLPAQDVIGRQQEVMRAFDAMRQSRKPVDLARVQAIEFLDAALGADRRQLIKQYVENYDSSPKLAERIWQAVYDLSQGFIYAYQTALEEALRQTGNARWKPLTPLLFARLVHYYGTDAKLRVFRFERWIPAKWMELHRTYLRASELGFERVAAVLGSAGPNASQWTVWITFTWRIPTITRFERSLLGAWLRPWPDWWAVPAMRMGRGALRGSTIPKELPWTLQTSST